jgi:hypothetical protein
MLRFTGLFGISEIMFDASAIEISDRSFRQHDWISEDAASRFTWRSTSAEADLSKRM